MSTEFGTLADVVIGRGEGFHRDPSRVEVVNTTQANTFRDRGHPGEAALIAEFSGFRAAMEAVGVRVHKPVLAPESVQDQTCPRDIGFVIGDTFVAAGMRVVSRVEEIAGVRDLLGRFAGRQVAVPKGICLEGGDVIVDDDCVFVGAGQRSDAAGADFLQAQFGETRKIVSLPCRGGPDDEDILHLDCTFNPLGLGHALIYPAGLQAVPDLLRERYDWIEVTRAEAGALATNVLSVAPDHVIARSHPSCARVNGLLRQAGYRVTEVDFDSVPGIGGSFRCATLPLRREA